MDILGDGSFTITMDAGDLSKGMRKSKRYPRNSKRLVECKGAVGYDGVLQVLDDLTDNVIDQLCLIYVKIIVFDYFTKSLNS